jgi:hypothetical protein
MGGALVVAGLTAGATSAQEDVVPKSSALARAAQQELYRLGCYNDQINGVWASPSRTAAQKFLSRVNARLPIEQPDETLLALLRSTKGFVCSQCPVGEAFNSAGDCVPKALVDKVGKSVPMTTGAIAEWPGPPEHASSDEPGAQREPAPPGKPAGQAAGATKLWRALLRKVDRALGFE